MAPPSKGILFNIHYYCYYYLPALYLSLDKACQISHVCHMLLLFPAVISWPCISRDPLRQCMFYVYDNSLQWFIKARVCHLFLSPCDAIQLPINKTCFHLCDEITYYSERHSLPELCIWNVN